MKPNKKLICEEALIQRILTLDIEPGAILDESLISEQYDLSRTPLREVFQRMAGEGYLSLKENRGAKVSSMDHKSMRYFFQTAPAIYSLISRLAAENASHEQLEKLKQTQQSFRRIGESGNTAGMSMFNHTFHQIIGEMAGNPYLMPSLKRLLIDHTRMSQMFYHPTNSVERRTVWNACDQHDQMIEAIKKREPETIVKITMEHWALSRDHIEKYVRPDPLEINFDFSDKQGIINEV